MADVLHRTDGRYLRSVHSPDYPAQDWLLNPDLSAVAGLPVEQWVVEGDTVRPATDAERLPALKAVRAAALADAVRAYAQARYPDREELRWRWRQAVDAGLTNRAAYIAQALTWGDAVLVEYGQRAAALAAAATVAEVAAISTDFGALDASDPGVTVLAALQVLD